MALETERSSPNSASSPGPSNSPNSIGHHQHTTYIKSISPQQDIKPPLIHHPLAIYPMILPQPLLRAAVNHHLINHQDQEPSLRFSVTNILRPEFGRRAVEECRLRTSIDNHRSKSSRSSSNDDCSRSFTSSPTARASSPGSTINNKNNNSYDSDESLCSSSRPSSSLDDKLVDPKKANKNSLWPAWVYCTRYSDRPSSGPRSRRMKKRERKADEKRPRTAFTQEQLGRLKREFDENRYLTERRRQQLANELGLHENQIKIWFQNKRAKIKKTTGSKGSLAIQLMAQGLYNHSTIPVEEEEELELAAAAAARGAEAAAAAVAAARNGVIPFDLAR